MYNYYAELRNSLSTIDTDVLKNNLLKKYNEDSIVLDNNELIHIEKYTRLVERSSDFTLQLPNKKGIYYFNENFHNQYISIKGSDTDIIRGYLDKLKIYQINLFYDKDLDIEVTPLLIEYSGHDVI